MYVLGGKGPSDLDGKSLDAGCAASSECVACLGWGWVVGTGSGCTERPRRAGSTAGANPSTPTPALHPGRPQFAARFVAPSNGRVMELWTTAPGLEARGRGGGCSGRGGVGGAGRARRGGVGAG